MRSTPGTKPGNSPEIIPQPDTTYDGRDMDHDTQPDEDTTVEQLDPTPTNPRRSKYDLRHNPKPNCNDDYRYWLCQITFYGTHTYTFRKPQERVMELICGEPTYSVKHLKALRNNYWALQTEEYKFWHLQILGIGSSSNYPNISSDDIWNVSGTTPEPARKIRQKFDSGYITEYIRTFLIIWGYSLYSDTTSTHFPHAKDGNSNWIQTIIKF